jgi:hypothetical protein
MAQHMIHEGTSFFLLVRVRALSNRGIEVEVAKSVREYEVKYRAKGRCEKTQVKTAVRGLPFEMYYAGWFCTEWERIGRRCDIVFVSL